MSSWIVALILAIGAGAWTYNQSARRTGNQANRDLTAGAAVGVFVFIIAFTLLHFTIG
jgi:hypothetical protein